MAEFEAKAAGQKCSPEVVFSTLRTFLTDNAGIGLPLGIERVIWIGSKAVYASSNTKTIYSSLLITNRQNFDNISLTEEKEVNTRNR